MHPVGLERSLSRMSVIRTSQHLFILVLSSCSLDFFVTKSTSQSIPSSCFFCSIMHACEAFGIAICACYHFPLHNLVGGTRRVSCAFLARVTRSRCPASRWHWSALRVSGRPHGTRAWKTVTRRTTRTAKSVSRPQSILPESSASSARQRMLSLTCWHASSTVVQQCHAAG